MRATTIRDVEQRGAVGLVDGEVVGHVTVSNAVLRSNDRDRQISMLSPLAVRPDLQKAGIGHSLVSAALGVAEERGEPLVVVEGSPTYDGRFGFEHSIAYGIEIDLPEWAPPEAAQVRRLRSFDPDDATLRGKMIYPTAFDGLA